MSFRMMSMDDYCIKGASFEDLCTAVGWAESNGWCPGFQDEVCYFKADSNGFFAGFLQGEMISFGSAVCYDDSYAFCGFYMVKPEFQGKGYGMALTQGRLQYVGSRVVGIDGVLDMVNTYEQIGYEPCYKNARFKGYFPLKHEPSDAIVAISHVPHDVLMAYDKACFGANREELISCWVTMPGRHALAYYQTGILKGYGVIRPTLSNEYRIGPLFADNSDIAEELLLSLLSCIDGSFYIDVPEINPQAMAWVNRFGLKEVFATIRMYRGGRPQDDTSKVFAITNFELG